MPKCKQCDADAQRFGFKDGKVIYICNKHASGRHMVIDPVVGWMRLGKVTKVKEIGDRP